MRPSTLNPLRVEVYSSGLIPVLDVDGSLARAQVISFETFYPGGLFGPAEIFVPRPVTRAWLVREGQRMAIFRGQQIVWEGKIAAIGMRLSDDQGIILTGAGAWGSLLNRTWLKVWADNRVSEDRWVRQSQGDQDAAANIDRLQRIQIGPQAIAWTNGQIVAAFRYTMPTGETIKRVVCSSKNRTSGQSWETRLRDTVGASNIWSHTADGTTVAHDDTLGTPRQYLELQFLSNANQTPAAAVYGWISGLMVYSETGGITPTSVMQDVRAHLSELNADESKIASNTYVLEPFYTSGAEPINAILSRAAGYGDASYNPWAAYVDASDRAAVPDGKPILCYQPYPDLSAADYLIRLDEGNLEGDVDMERAVLGAVINYIILHYRDDANSRDVWLTPDDNAALKDTASIALWEQQDYVLDAGSANEAEALNWAQRILAANKDARYKLASGVTVKGTLRSTQGPARPVSTVRAGQRVRVENFLSDVVGVADAGLTFLITGTRYTAASESLEITMGLPDQLATYLAQRALLDSRRLR